MANGVSVLDIGGTLYGWTPTLQPITDQTVGFWSIAVTFTEALFDREQPPAIYGSQQRGKPWRPSRVA